VALGTPTATNGMDTVARIARRLRRRPVCVMGGAVNAGFYVAEWRFPPYHRLSTDCVPDHTLCFHLSGTAPVSKLIDGRLIRKRANPGAVSFVPMGEPARFSLGEEIAAIEIYLAPALVRAFCEECADTVRAVSIEPFFAAEDPWLKGYFQMLAAEMRSHGGARDPLDSLLLGQSRQMLLAHLLRRYSDLGRYGRRELNGDSAARRLPLPLLNRVTNFVEQHLATDIRLADLASLAHLSERHFIRAFRAATGVTPYRYVVEKRLRVAAQLLHIHDTRSIADIARAAGFKSQAHFAAEFRSRYRVTPTRYRRLGDLDALPRIRAVNAAFGRTT
jgi:AraC family transcriptional regulator